MREATVNSQLKDTMASEAFTFGSDLRGWVLLMAASTG
jgi:hypothetical protein